MIPIFFIFFFIEGLY